jgi:hypothetical protein
MPIREPHCWKLTLGNRKGYVAGGIAAGNKSVARESRTTLPPASYTQTLRRKMFKKIYVQVTYNLKKRNIQFFYSVHGIRLKLKCTKRATADYSDGGIRIVPGSIFAWDTDRLDSGFSWSSPYSTWSQRADWYFAKATTVPFKTFSDHTILDVMYPELLKASSSKS